jgi:hypothetical protein
MPCADKNSSWTPKFSSTMTECSRDSHLTLAIAEFATHTS